VDFLRVMVLLMLDENLGWGVDCFREKANPTFEVIRRVVGVPLLVVLLVVLLVFVVPTMWFFFWWIEEDNKPNPLLPKFALLLLVLLFPLRLVVGPFEVPLEKDTP